MAGNPNPSDVNKPTTDERGRRMRIIWLSSIANLTIVVFLAALWIQKAFTVQIIAVLALVLMLIVNAALWFGWQADRARRRAKRPLKPLFLFLVGGLAVVDAIVEIASKDFASSGMLLLGGIGAVALATIVIRNNARRTLVSPDTDRQE
jgi:di/tricarboxylate transporter